MELTVKNFRGIESAAIQIDPVALVAGPNSAGKSSVAMAMAACLRQTPMPIDGIAKNQAGLLLRRQAKRGSASLTSGNGAVQVNWPGGSVSADTETAMASEYAAGIVSVCGMTTKAAATALRAYIGADPTREDLREALPATEVPDAVVWNIWEAIEKDGWDAAHRRAKESGTKAKGRWEQITGEDYGAKKALSWVSPLVPSDDSRTVAEVEAALGEAQAKLEELIAQQALSDDERQRLEDQAHAPQQDLKDMRLQVDTADRAVQEARDYYQSLARPVAMKDPLHCPHCGGEVEMDAGQLVVFTDEIDNGENLRRAAAITAARDALQEADAAAVRARDALNAVQRQHQQASEAAAKLAQYAGRSVGPDVIQAYRDAVSHQQNVLMGLQATEQAEKVAVGIQINGFIVEALAPDGLRKTVMARAMGKFNDRLAALSAIAGWGEVQVSDDMAITYDGGPYALLSASEQFRCRVTLQLAMAEIDESRALVIDAADILDRAGRNQLFKVVRAIGIPALITMTMNAEADVPDLAKAGMGRSYWIDDAIADPIG